jgi:hypothetical protein
MSMTLILWKAPVVDDPDQAKKLTEAWYKDEDDSVFEPSGDIARVADELRRRWPYWPISGEEVVGAMSEEERGRYTEQGLAELRESGSVTQDKDGPWADLPFYESDRLLSVDIRWGADGEVVAAIVALARKYELVLYDPQGPDVFLPTDPIEELTEFPGFKLDDWLKIGAMVLVLSALTYAAWLIPIGWLKWPAVLVAGFVAAAGLFVLGAMIAATLGFIDISEGRKPCADEQPPL